MTPVPGEAIKARLAVVVPEEMELKKGAQFAKKSNRFCRRLCRFDRKNV